MRILLVEDQQKLSDFISQGMLEMGFDVDVALESEAAEKLLLNKSYDVLIFDVLLPGRNGFELCRSIRIAGIQTPVIFLTALDTTDDKVKGFDAGGDDFLIKPFEFRELVARIKALARRNKRTEQSISQLQIHDLILDLEKKNAYRNSILIDLTAKEFHLLEYLIKNKNKVLSRADIALHVWEIDFDSGTNVIDVYVNILRKKIDKGFDKKLLHTKIGLGYYISDKEW